MNRRAPLILVNQPELIGSGLWPDRHPFNRPLWEVARNVKFTGGKVVRRVPNALMFDAGPDPLRGLGQRQASDGVRWVYGVSGGRVVRWYGPAPEELHTGFDWNLNATVNEPATYFDLTPWGDWMLINSKENGIWRHRPGVDFALLPNAPDDAVAFFKKRNQLMAVGYGTNGHLVGISDADDITDWDFASTTNIATELALEEADTPVRAGCHMGTSVAVFTETQMFAINWLGAPFYWGQNKLLDGIGCVGKMACCVDGRLAFGVSRNGCWKTDGTTYEYIDEVVLRDYLQNNINWDQASKIQVEKNHVSGCIEFSFPMGASLECNEAWSHDPRFGGWGQVPAFEIMQRRVLFDKPLQGNVAGEVQLMEDFPEAAGDLDLRTHAMLIQRDDTALHVGAIIDEVEILAHKASNVEFRYVTAEFPDGPWTPTGWFEISTKQQTYQLDTRVSGVYHALQFKNYEQEWDLDLQGFALFGQVEGQKREKS